MQKIKNKKSKLLYSIHLPILTFMLGMLILNYGGISNIVNSQQQMVMGDEDERDTETDENNDDDQEDEHEETNDEDASGEDSEENHTSSDDENDPEDKEEDEDTDDVKPALPIGTLQRPHIVVEDEDKAEVEDDDKTENETEKEDTAEDAAKDELEDNLDNSDEDDQEIEFEYTSTVGGAPKLSKLVEAKLEQEIETNPELGTTENEIELEVKTANGKFEYEGTMFKNEKLFGLLPVTLDLGIEIDPDTGKILSVNQTFWSKLLDALSF